MSRLSEAARGYEFDHITLVPQRNHGTPGDVSLASCVTKTHRLPLPMVSAGMPSVTESAMAIAMAEFGGMGVIHRFMSVEMQCEMVRMVKHHPIGPEYKTPALGADGQVICAVSCDPRDAARALTLAGAGADILFLDTPNPESEGIAAAVASLRSQTSAALVIGSVVNGETAKRYIDLGIDAIKVGLGAGALCSIRKSAGIGLPQATALDRVCPIAAAHGVPVISDGGCRHPGDVVKALALGASAVMVGSLLTGCDESPGERVTTGGAAPMKRAAGLRLADFELELPSGYPKVDTYLQANPVPRVEGRDELVPASGPCHLHLLMWMRSIRMGLHLSGARDIPELWRTAEILLI